FSPVCCPCINSAAVYHSSVAQKQIQTEFKMMKFFKNFKSFLNPDQEPDLTEAFTIHRQTLPTLWLLGKTGAGKSTLIHAVTGNSRIEIGNGFSPCTNTAYSYDFPEDKPLMRFLDTRGLGEENYDPKEDILACQNRSNALLLVMKAEDPEQSHVLSALKQIRDSGRIKHVLLVHTAVYMIEDEHQRFQCVAYNENQVKKVWEQPIDSVQVDFELNDGSTFGVNALTEKLSGLMPIIAELMEDHDIRDQEKKNFIRLKKEILWHSGIAGASDVIPVTGTLTVPAVQARMLGEEVSREELMNIYENAFESIKDAARNETNNQ
ncbi:MAG: 50S ribosome-binding GTPase, partial [Desulfovibrionales bacterium]|nr:50S ribosome-binding GTPase [Desulfovibrionales bacterium]